MRAYSKQDLDLYMKEDPVGTLLSNHPDDSTFASHQWLLDIPAKRMIYKDIYGPLLTSTGKRVLDIGGGYCGLTRTLVQNHDYTLVDCMVHDDHQRLAAIEKEMGKSFWNCNDWDTYPLEGEYDVIIANDIFPNVDQRIVPFLRKVLPFAKQIILTLTCYDIEQFYTVRRVDADEILTVQAWTSDVTTLALATLTGVESSLVRTEGDDTLFRNGRVVYRLDVPSL